MIEENNDARTWAALSHLSALLMLVMVFGNVLGPLVVWLLKRNEYPFVDEQGKEALNFQISMAIYGFVAAMIMVFMMGTTAFFWPFHHGMWDFWFPMRMPFAIISATFLVMGIFVLDLVLLIVAAIKASNGERYRYPITIRFVK